jgi:hypothetical protein
MSSEVIVIDEDDKEEEKKKKETEHNWKVKCHHCVLHVHASRVKHHYESKHKDVDIPSSMMDSHLAYRRHRAKIRLAKSKHGGISKSEPKAKPHHTRHSIPLVCLPKERTKPFADFLRSAFGGSMGPSYAQELASIYGRMMCFEHVQGSTPSEQEVEEHLSDTGRFARLFSKMEGEWNCRAATIEKWLQAALKAARWRAHMLTQVSEHTQEIKERIYRLELIDKYFMDYGKALSKKRHHEQKHNAPSIDERVSQGNWCTSDEWKQAVERGSEDFMAIIHKAQQDNTQIDNVYYQDAQNYCLALFYCENRPSRPGFLRALTMENWETIKNTGTYSTREFKTSNLYGEQVFTFGKNTIQAWSLYVDLIRPRYCGASEQRLFTHSEGGSLRVARCLTSFSKMYMDKHITPTTLRGILATEAEDELSRADADAIHRADTHTSAVVARHYDHRAAVRASTRADEVFRELRSPDLLNLAVLHSSSPSLPSETVATITSQLSIQAAAPAAPAPAPTIPPLEKIQADGDDNTFVPDPNPHPMIIDVEAEAEAEADHKSPLLDPIHVMEEEKQPAAKTKSKPKAKRIRFSREEVRYICDFITKNGSKGVNWIKLLDDGLAEDVFHSKRTPQSLRDCWRSVEKGCYITTFGIGKDGRPIKKKKKKLKSPLPPLPTTTTTTKKRKIGTLPADNSF